MRARRRGITRSLLVGSWASLTWKELRSFNGLNRFYSVMRSRGFTVFRTIRRDPQTHLQVRIIHRVLF